MLNNLTKSIMENSFLLRTISTLCFLSASIPKSESRPFVSNAIFNSHLGNGLVLQNVNFGDNRMNPFAFNPNLHFAREANNLRLGTLGSPFGIISSINSPFNRPHLGLTSTGLGLGSFSNGRGQITIPAIPSMPSTNSMYMDSLLQMNGASTTQSSHLEQMHITEDGSKPANANVVYGSSSFNNLLGGIVQSTSGGAGFQDNQGNINGGSSQIYQVSTIGDNNQVFVLGVSDASGAGNVFQISNSDTVPLEATNLADGLTPTMAGTVSTATQEILQTPVVDVESPSQSNVILSIVPLDTSAAEASTIEGEVQNVGIQAVEDMLQISNENQDIQNEIINVAEINEHGNVTPDNSAAIILEAVPNSPELLIESQDIIPNSNDGIYIAEISAPVNVIPENSAEIITEMVQNSLPLLVEEQDITPNSNEVLSIGELTEPNNATPDNSVVIITEIVPSSVAPSVDVESPAEDNTILLVGIPQESDPLPSNYETLPELPEQLSEQLLINHPVDHGIAPESEAIVLESSPIIPENQNVELLSPISESSHIPPVVLVALEEPISEQSNLNLEGQVQNLGIQTVENVLQIQQENIPVISEAPIILLQEDAQAQTVSNSESAMNENILDVFQNINSEAELASENSPIINVIDTILPTPAQPETIQMQPDSDIITIDETSSLEAVPLIEALLDLEAELASEVFIQLEQEPLPAQAASESALVPEVLPISEPPQEYEMILFPEVTPEQSENIISGETLDTQELVPQSSPNGNFLDSLEIAQSTSLSNSDQESGVNNEVGSVLDSSHTNNENGAADQLLNLYSPLQAEKPINTEDNKEPVVSPVSETFVEHEEHNPMPTFSELLLQNETANLNEESVSNEQSIVSFADLAASNSEFHIENNPIQENQPIESSPVENNHVSDEAVISFPEQIETESHPLQPESVSLNIQVESSSYQQNIDDIIPQSSSIDNAIIPNSESEPEPNSTNMIDFTILQQNPIPISPEALNIQDVLNSFE